MAERIGQAKGISGWNVVSRVATAAFGGYWLTYALTALCARLLPTSAADAVLIATNLSFAVYPIVVMIVFGRRNLPSTLAAMLAITGLSLLVVFGLNG